MTGQMNAIDLTIGIHSSKSPAFDNEISEDRTMRRLLNGLNIGGWFPFIGTIVGIARLIFTAIMKKNDFQKNKLLGPEAKAFYAVMTLRSIVELCGLGFVFLLPDLIYTVGREIANAPLKSSNYSAKPYKDNLYNSQNWRQDSKKFSY